MPDPRRLESPFVEAADRDSRAEALLVEGLDQYIAGRYEDAIHLWTRVLFLDRSHARARAYIDRARTAVAERQRRADEMIQASQDLLAEGKTVAARDLLDRAVAAAGDDDRAAELRARLERMERARPPIDRPRLAVVDAVPVRRRPSRAAAAAMVAAGAGALVLGWLAVSRARGWFANEPATLPLAAATRPAALPVLSTSDVALVRARTLYSRGRLANALRALDRVDADGPTRPDADRLRTEIQQLLLATGRGGDSADSQRP